MLLLLITVSELVAARVDGQGVVSLSLVVEDVSASYVGGHGVLAEMLVSSVTRYGILSLVLTVTELTAG